MPHTLLCAAHRGIFSSHKVILSGADTARRGRVCRRKTLLCLHARRQLEPPAAGRCRVRHRRRAQEFEALGLALCCLHHRPPPKAKAVCAVHLLQAEWHSRVRCAARSS